MAENIWLDIGTEFASKAVEHARGAPNVPKPVSQMDSSLTAARKALEGLSTADKAILADELVKAARNPIQNDELANYVPPHQSEMMGNWLLFLPPAAVAQFQLEPNMNADTGLERTLWVGRLCHFRKIRWLQYCKARTYSLEVPDERKSAFEKLFAAKDAHASSADVAEMYHIVCREL